MHHLKQNLIKMNEMLSSASFQDLQETQIQNRIAEYLKGKGLFFHMDG